MPKSSRAKSSQTKNQLKSTKSFTKKTPEPMRESSVWNIFYLGIFFIPLLINPWGTMPFEIAKSGWLLLFIGVFMFGSAIAIFTQKNVLQINKKVLLVIGLWIISFAASTIFSIAPIQSWWGSYERIQGTMTAVFYLFHFQICLQIFQDKQLQQKFFNIALGIGALISTHAIAQKLHMDPLLLGNIDEASGRSYSTLGQPNFLGQWLIFPFFIAFHKLFQTHQRNKDKIFAAISVGLSAIALFCAMNRATIIALVIAIFIFWLIQSTKRVHKVGIGLLLVAAVGANVLIFNQDLRSFNSRAVLWQSSLNLVSRTPIFGFGPETFYQTTQTVLDPKVYLTETLYNIPDRVHNEPLQTLLDQGWFGFGLYILNWIFIAWILLKKKAKTPAAQIALFTVIATLISSFFSFLLTAHMVYLMAMWAILLTETLPWKEITLRFNIFAKIIISLLFFGIGIFGIYRATTVVMADITFSNAIQSYFVSPQLAKITFQQANELNPQSAYLLYNMNHFLATAHQFQQDPQTAEILRKNLETLATITNKDFHYYIAAAKLSLAQNNPNQADEFFSQAAKKAPNWPYIWQEWGNQLFKQKKYPEALSKYQKLLELAPPYWQWKNDPAHQSHEDQEKLRIFKKTHDLFYESLHNLFQIYIETNDAQKAAELQKMME